MRSLGDEVEAWLDDSGFERIQNCVSELRAKGLQRIYVSNFDFIPDDIDKTELCRQLNQDSGDWNFFMEDVDVVASIKNTRRA